MISFLVAQSIRQPGCVLCSYLVKGNEDVKKEQPNTVSYASNQVLSHLALLSSLQLVLRDIVQQHHNALPQLSPSFSRFVSFVRSFFALALSVILPGFRGESGLPGISF